MGGIVLKSRFFVLAALLVGVLEGCNVGTIDVSTPESGTGSGGGGSVVTALQLQTTAVGIIGSGGFVNPAPTFNAGVSDVVRNLHRANTLRIGTGASAKEVVMILGGESTNGRLSSTLVYDEISNQWSLGTPMNTARDNFSSNVIKLGTDQHEGLIVIGGFDTNLNPLSSVEIYDPVGGAGGTPVWRNVAPLNQARAYHTSTLLPDGRIFVVAGGTSLYNPSGTILASVEIYDPVLDTWTTLAPLSGELLSHCAVAIKVGADHHDAVLVAGGYRLGSSVSDAVYYDLSSSAWVSAGNLPVATSRAAAVVLANGSVIVSGGEGNGYAKYSETEIYVPSSTATPSTTWTPLHNLNFARYGHTLSVLPNNTLLAVGGYGGAQTFDSEVYSVSGDTWTNSGLNAVFRFNHSANVLADGRLLVFGGDNTGSSTQANSTEIFQTYASAQPVPTSGTAPYTYTLKSGNGKLASTGLYVPNQFSPEVAVITVKDSLGAQADFTVVTVHP